MPAPRPGCRSREEQLSFAIDRFCKFRLFAEARLHRVIVELVVSKVVYFLQHLDLFP